mmetsp:Transcript_69803/g.149383  ORF Transcript_69803/g.149383 Transcript_69803/m.149383 type:complete len:230 (+) Transcript_69803:955-1644(+)
MGVPVRPQAISQRIASWAAAADCLDLWFRSSCASSTMILLQELLKRALRLLFSSSDTNVWKVVSTRSKLDNDSFSRSTPWKVTTRSEGQCSLAWASQLESKDNGHTTMVPQRRADCSQLSETTRLSMVAVFPSPISSQSNPPRGMDGASAARTKIFVITFRKPSSAPFLSGFQNSTEAAFSRDACDAAAPRACGTVCGASRCLAQCKALSWCSKSGVATLAGCGAEGMS